MLGRRSETLAFRRSKRQGLTMNVTERYHRSDIPCAASSCTRCPRNTDLAKQGLAMLQVPGTIIVPDASVVSRYIEVLEQADGGLENIVFCQTVLDALDRRNRTRTMRNVRRIAADSRRRAVVFANEVFSETLEKARGPTAVERDMRAVLRAAQWYKRHLGKETRVVLLTLKNDLYMEGDDDDLGGRVEICRMDEFIGRHCPALKTHFDSVTAATEDGDMDITALTPAQYAAARLQAKAHGEFGRHLSPDEIAEGLRSGELIRGKIRIMQRTRGVVERADGLPSIEVVGRAALNRACSGDSVVVRLLGHGEAAAQDAESADSDDEGGVSDREDDLADAGDEPVAEQTQTAAVRGVVVGVAQRSWRPYVATLQADDSGGARHLAVPVDVNVPKIRFHYMDVGVLESQYFVVAIDSWPSDSQYPQGHFVRILGPVRSLDTQIDAILVERQIATSQKTLRFSEAIMREMPEDSEEHPWFPSEADLAGRRDLRDWLVFSIDPKGCVDIDDAMSMRRVDGGGFELGVHIADVAHFIAPGAAADQEARARGTTVYLADRRFNMIPEVLSEHVCSLHENVDRLAVSVVWQLDEAMHVRDVWFGRSVIRSACELSYEQAQAMLDGCSGGLAAGLEPRVLASLTELTSAMRVLRQRRMEAGALELASTEVKFGFDEVTSEVTELSTKKSLEVHRVVEEAMVFANAAVARRIHEAFPRSALLRRHRSPTSERFDRLVRAVASRGFAIDCSSNAALARSLQTISRERADDPDLVFLAKSMATLAMQEADYFATGNCEVPAFMHYGLALEFYTHFTSPIRRYADVVVHRQLIEAVGGACDGLVASQQWVGDTAVVLNERNRQSKLAQRESAELFQSRFVAQKTGHEPLVCDGVVAEIRTNGLIVYVPQLGLRGPVHLRDALKDHIKLPLSAITARVADADEAVDGCEDFAVEPTSLSIRLPASRPGERVLSFGIFDHVRVLVRVQDSGRRRPQVYLTIVGRPYSRSSLPPAKSKHAPPVGGQRSRGRADTPAADPADVPKCTTVAAASSDADSHLYAVVQKFAVLQRTSSADGESDDSGELWISPKISRAATLQSEPRESAETLLSQVAVLRHVHSETSRSIPIPSEKQRVHTRRKAHVRNQRQQQQQQKRQQDDIAELSLARVIAWYVPRVVLLFLIGWVCSAGVQLIHAQQQQRADSSDSSDSDETDGEFPYESLFGWQTAGSGDLTRDLIGRVLGQAAWSNGISGLLTVVVGLMYPYVDYKWRGISQQHVDWYSILRCVGGFLGVNYAALKLPFESANQSALILIIISMGLWTVCDGTLRGWLLSMNASLMATWFLYVHALTNLDSLFTRDDYLRLLSCLPSVLFTYCLMAGIIGRRLASKSPLWTMHPLPSVVELTQRSLGTVSSSASGFM
ncbi:hypothetical protein GGI15_000783 [Coemansia interrupta]|uniref:DIS3-like exonuclease 1 n=1 Tax=Coemansia interrupta TaxID=1126814 RepID=A0A9W8HJD2_9FUNG|nr:hypothetical protein GGI15_000783 [Coemansia interrupta]